jgi:hypothetical protein
MGAADLGALAGRVDRSAVRAAAAKAEADGASVADVWLSHLCRKDAPGAAVASGVWRQIPIELRAVLITMACPERKAPDVDAAQGWASFSPDERIALGALARTWRQGLGGAAWLR